MPKRFFATPRYPSLTNSDKISKELIFILPASSQAG